MPNFFQSKPDARDSARRHSYDGGHRFVIHCPGDPAGSWAVSLTDFIDERRGESIESEWHKGCEVPK